MNLDVDLQLSAEDDAYYQKMIDDIFKGRDDKEVISFDKKGIQITAKKLSEAISEGYGKSFDKVDYNTPDDGMLKAMEKNIYDFSAAKTHQQLQDLNKALFDGKRVKSFDEFKRDASVILNEYKVRHLRTEYNHAIAAAQMCRKWQEFPEGALLKYETVGDERVRVAHAELDGVVAVKESEFWDNYYPPLDWGCRCSVHEVLNETETDLSTIVIPDVPKNFVPNVGVYGQVYSKNSGYFQGIPAGVLAAGVLAMPVDRQYKVIHENKNGGRVKLHYIAESQNETDLPIKIMRAKQMADRGHVVEILPIIEPKDVETRKIVLPNVIEGKNPEYRIDGVYGDLKNPENPSQSTLIKNLRKYGTQSEFPVIDYSFDVNKSMIEATCTKKVKGNGKIKQVYIFYNDGSIVLIKNAKT